MKQLPAQWVLNLDLDGPGLRLVIEPYSATGVGLFLRVERRASAFGTPESMAFSLDLAESLADRPIVATLVDGDARGPHAALLVGGLLWRHLWRAPPPWALEMMPETCAWYGREVSRAENDIAYSQARAVFGGTR